MKRITILLSALLLGTALMAQTLSPRDIEKMRMLGEQPQMVNDLNPDATQFPMEPTDALYDLLFQFPVGDIGGTYSVATDGQYIYSARWNALLFHKYEMNGTLIGSFTIAGAGNIRDLAYDGQYFYGAPNSTTIYKMDFTTNTLVGTITAPAAVRGIAYDAVNDGFWVTNGWNPPIRLISRTGATLQTLNTVASSFSGIAWENVTPGGPWLWAYTQPASNNILVKINPTTGATESTYDLAGSVTFAAGTISGGMEITDQVYPGKWAFLGVGQNDVIWAVELADSAPVAAPGAATNLVATAGAMGALNATINWNNPALTVGGDPLAELTSVMLYRDDVLIHTVATPVIGGAVSYTDNAVPAAGNVTYKVIGENTAGAGIPTMVTVYVGEDVPAAPGNVVLAPQGNNGYLTWTAPTAGLNGGYFTGTGVMYDVKRMPGDVVVATNLTGLTYLDTTIPGAGNYSYKVTAKNAVGVGGTGTSNVALLGAEGLLMFETFEGVGGLPTGWQIAGLGTTNWSKVNTANAGGTAPEMQLSWSPSFVGESRLYTPAMNLQGTTQLKLKMNQYLNDYSTNTGEVIAVGYSVDGGATWVDVWSFVCDLSYGPVLDEWIFDVPAGSENIHIGFKFSGDSFNINYWYFDNVILEKMGGPVVTPGDANCDGTVNVIDVITIVNYILGQNPQPFCPENADVNNDGNINVIDIIGTVTIILGGK